MMNHLILHPTGVQRIIQFIHIERGFSAGRVHYTIKISVMVNKVFKIPEQVHIGFLRDHEIDG